MLRIPFRLIGNLFRLIAFAWSTFFFWLGKRARRKNKTYLEWRLEPFYAFGSSDAGMRRWFSPSKPSLLELRQSIKRVQESDDVDGVLITMESLNMGGARAGELIELLDKLRESGKELIIQTDGGGAREVMLLSAGDERLLTPAGRLYLFGLRFEEIFAKDLLDKLGIKGQFIHIGGFKTATHRMHKSGMTQPQRLMMTSLQRGFARHMSDRLEERMQITPAALDDAMLEAPLDAVRSRASGLTTGESFSGSMKEWLWYTRNELDDQSWKIGDQPRQLGAPDKCQTEDDDKDGDKDELETKEFSILSMENYLRSKPQLRFKRLFGRPRYVALLDLNGAIVMEGQNPGPLSRGGVIQPSEVVPVLKQLAEDRRCLGVLLHVNSPGGSALASDLMWREIKVLDQQKPVICYCSDVAASGGYYLACGARAIICRPNSIVGSIGVITGKIALQGLLEKFDVHIEAIEQNPNSRLMSALAPLDEKAMSNFQRDAREFYVRFLERVGQARGIERRRLHRYARGRVYLGESAKERGLVDGLGGFEEALAKLLDACGTDEASTQIQFIEHRKQTLRQTIISGAGAQAELLSPLEQIPDALTGPLQLASWLEQERVLALMPYNIDA